jgi:hypothetical protein
VARSRFSYCPPHPSHQPSGNSICLAIADFAAATKVPRSVPRTYVCGDCDATAQVVAPDCDRPLTHGDVGG